MKRLHVADPDGGFKTESGNGADLAGSFRKDFPVENRVNRKPVVSGIVVFFKIFSDRHPGGGLNNMNFRIFLFD